MGDGTPVCWTVLYGAVEVFQANGVGLSNGFSRVHMMDRQTDGQTDGQTDHATVTSVAISGKRYRSYSLRLPTEGWPG